MQDIRNFLERLGETLSWTIGGFPLWRMLVIALILAVMLLAKRLTAKLVSRALMKLVSKTKTKLDDYLLEAMDKPLQMLIIVGGLHLAAVLLPWGNWITTIGPGGVEVPDTERIILITGKLAAVFAIFYTWIGAYFAWVLVDRLAAYGVETIRERNVRFDPTIVVTLRKFLKVVVVAIAGAMTLDRMGQDVGMILASFTVVGAAAAFAARDTIANVFAAIVLSLDRPFSIGDWVVIGNIEGTVEELGMRSTKVRTFAKSVVHIPNNQLMNMSIENMSARPRQRVKAYIGVTYDSPPEKVEALVEGIKEIIRTNPNTFKDYYQVWFTEFADSSLQIMLYFYIESREWEDFLRERQRIFLDIMKLVQSLGLEFAFPTQTIFLHQEEGEKGQ